MLCCRKTNKENKENRSRSATHKEQFTRKLLLLGTGGSGKSTFFKQMRIIHGGGYNDEERRKFIPIIRSNILEAVRSLVKAMDHMKIAYENEENRLHGEAILNIDTEKQGWMDEEYVRLIKSLWNDRGIQEAFSKRNRFNFLDSAEEYILDIDRIAKSGYVPTQDDIVRSRDPTTDIVEDKFDYKGYKFRIVDLGGQKDMRAKLAECYENCYCIIFLAAMSEYDQNLEENPEENSLEESKCLFRVICSHEWFSDTPIILFLNKRDLLKKKIQYSHLSDHFRDYKGPKHDEQKAKEFIHDMFMDQLKQAVDNRQIYVKFTCATDTNHIKLMFGAVVNEIFQDKLRKHDETF